MLTKTTVAMLNEAVQAELYASHLYRHLANQMQRLGYFGAQKFFASEAMDELEHYQKLVDVMNDLGTVAATPSLEAVSDKVSGLKDAFGIALETEVQLGADYERWYKATADVPMVQESLHFFLEKQRKSIGEFQDWLARMDRAGSNEAALLIIDKELGE